MATTGTMADSSTAAAPRYRPATYVVGRWVGEWYAPQPATIRTPACQPAHPSPQPCAPSLSACATQPAALCAQSTAYGPRFKSGDVVGCGVSVTSRRVFFTLNGSHTYLLVPDTCVRYMYLPCIALMCIYLLPTQRPPYICSSRVAYIHYCPWVCAYHTCTHARTHHTHTRHTHTPAHLHARRRVPRRGFHRQAAAAAALPGGH